MNRIVVELLGKKCTLKAPEDSVDVMRAVQEVQRRGEEIASYTKGAFNREDLLMLISLNLAQELNRLRPEAASDESR